MDHNHKLDAPNNDTLKDVEQLTDRSELSALYFKGKKEWDGKKLISEDERQAQREHERLTISSSIRRWFVVIGLLVPTPFALLVLLILFASENWSGDNIQFLLPVACLSIVAWGAASYAILKKTHTIFYNHALRLLPFYVIIGALLIPVAATLYTLSRPFFGNILFVNTALVLTGVYLASIALSGAMVTIWTSSRMSSRHKISSLFGMASLILVAAAIIILS